MSPEQPRPTNSEGEFTFDMPAELMQQAAETSELGNEALASMEISEKQMLNLMEFYEGKNIKGLPPLYQTIGKKKSKDRLVVFTIPVRPHPDSMATEHVVIARSGFYSYTDSREIYVTDEDLARRQNPSVDTKYSYSAFFRTIKGLEPIKSYTSDSESRERKIVISHESRPAIDMRRLRLYDAGEANVVDADFGYALELSPEEAIEKIEEIVQIADSHFGWMLAESSQTIEAAKRLSGPGNKKKDRFSLGDLGVESPSRLRRIYDNTIGRFRG